METNDRYHEEVSVKPPGLRPLTRLDGLQSGSEADECGARGSLVEPLTLTAPPHSIGPHVASKASEARPAVFEEGDCSH